MIDYFFRLLGSSINWRIQCIIVEMVEFANFSDPSGAIFS